MAKDLNLYQKIRAGGGLAAAAALLSSRQGKKEVKKMVNQGKKMVRKRKPSVGKKQRTLEKRVRRLERDNGDTMTRFINKGEGSTTLFCNSGLKTYFSTYGYGLDAVLDTVNNAEVWDRSTFEFVTGQFGSGPEQKSFTIDSAKLVTTITNVSQKTVRVRYWLVKPKYSTVNNISVDLPLTAADIVTDVTTMNHTNLCYDVYENSHIKKSWSFSRTKSFVLKPGQRRSLTYLAKNIKWDDETVYSTWDKRLKSAIMLFEFVGEYGHRVTSGNVDATTTSDSRVIVSYQVESRAKYDGGTEALRLRMSQGSLNNIGEGVIYNAMQPIVDMQQNSRT